jgi:hypothetical protein
MSNFSHKNFLKLWAFVSRANFAFELIPRLDFASIPTSLHFSEISTAKFKAIDSTNLVKIVPITWTPLHFYLNSFFNEGETI